MKVFAAATAALVGSAWATPLIFSSNTLNQLHHRGSNNQMEQPTMKSSQLSAHRQMSDRQKSSRPMSPMDLALRKMSPHLTPADRMSLADQKMSHRNMYGHQLSRSQLAKQKMSMLDRQQMSSFEDQDQQGKQFYKNTDQKGNYAYGYSYGNSEKFEQGNSETGVKGHYTFVDANGENKRVDYIADKEGFRILNDDSANSNRIKREVKPDLVRTRMSSYMDSSSLRKDQSQQDRLTSMAGRDMSDNTRNQYMMDANLRNQNMIGQDIHSEMMNGQNMRSNIYDNTMAQDMSNSMIKSNMMGHAMSSSKMRPNMYSNEMGRDMPLNMISRNMLGGNILGQDMSSNMMTGNLIDRMTGRDMSSNVMNRMNAYGNGINGFLGQRSVMGQRMEMERFPGNHMVNQLF